VRDRIWTELTQAKHNEEFAALYAERQRSLLQWFNIFVLIFSAGGVMGWKYWDNFPLVACILIGAVSLLRQLQPQIIMSEKQIINLDNISVFYFNFYNKLERLWYDCEDKSIDHEASKSEFFIIKESEAAINCLVSETIKSKPNRLVKKAQQYSDQYFNRSFNTQNNG